MGARRGSEYLRGLRDDREVWLGGERVRDVTAHAGLRRGAESVAALYDMQHDPQRAGVMTYASPTSGEPVGRSFEPPRTADDLRARRAMMRAWASETFGMMGRSPDFLNVMMMLFAARRDVFDRGGRRFGDNVCRYYEHVREGDRCLSHTLLNPQVDRSRTASQQADPGVSLRKVGESDRGIIVRGARMLATLAPLADEITVFPYTRLGQAEDDYALVFAIPVATPGLRLLCRESFDRGGSAVDHPLGARFEEMDAVVIFDDVLVPWERVFVNANAKLYNSLMPSLGTMAHAGYQVAVRTEAKCELVLGLAERIVRAIGIGEFLHVQEKMGELVTYLDTVRACLDASEAQAKMGPGDILYPAEGPLHAVKNLFPRWYPRMVEILQLLGAGGLMMVPPESALDGPMGDVIAKYYAGTDCAARERIRLFRAAWELSGEAIGSRQVLYERFFGGDPIRNLAARYRMSDLTACVQHVARLL
jgi:4-hydroxyphenylacetate 3-monooxygenase